VLGFQVLLALTAILGAGTLVLAANVRQALIGGALMIGAGALFWFLIKAMARIQMPQRPGARPG
jgi:hypothetical protein